MLRPSGPQYDIINSKMPLNLFHSGQGAGKTYTMGVLSFNFIQYCPASTGFIGANTYMQLSQSTLMEIFNVWKAVFDFVEGRDFVKDKQPPAHFDYNGVRLKSYANTIVCKNGALIFVGSLDNYNVHEGKTVAWAMLDETKDTKEDAVKDVILARLRQGNIYLDQTSDPSNFRFPYSNREGSGIVQNPLYIFTSPAKSQWLGEMFELEKHREDILSRIFQPGKYFYLHQDSRCVVISSTYHNAHNLPPGYIEHRMGILTPDKIEMNIYGSPFGKSGAEYYSAFDHAIHVVATRADSSLPFHISFDFNVNPYMPAIIVQITPAQLTTDNRTKVKALNEIALESPRNTIEDVCSTFRAEYGHMISAGLFYYGDATGKNRIPVKETRNYYNVIKKAFYGLVSQSSKRVLSQNPRHQAVGRQTLGRRDFMNACLKGAFGFDILIDPKCKHLIADLQFLKEDANGAKLKKKETKDGVTFEKYGHMSDALDALVCYVFEKHYR